MKVSLVLLLLLVVVALVAGWGDSGDDKSRSSSSDSGSKSDKSDKKSTKSDSHSKSSKSDSKHKGSKYKSDSQSKSGKSDSHSKSSKSDSHSKSSKSDSHSKSTKSDSHSKSTKSDSHSKSTKSDSHSKSTKSDSHSKGTKSDMKPERPRVRIDCPYKHKLQCWQCHANDDHKCRAIGKWQQCEHGETCFMDQYRDRSGKQYVSRGCRSPRMCERSEWLYPNCKKTSRIFKCTTCGGRCWYQCVKPEEECPVKCRKCKCTTERECQRLNTFEICKGYKEPVCEQKSLTLKHDKTYFVSGCCEKDDCMNQKGLYPKCYYSASTYSNLCVKCVKPIEIDCKPTTPKPTTPKPTTPKPTTPKPTTPKPTTPKPTTPKPTTPKPTTPKPTTPKPTTPKPTTPKPKCPEEDNDVLNYANRNKMTVTIFGPRAQSLQPFHNFLKGSREEFLFVRNDGIVNRVQIDFKKKQNIAGITAQSKFSDFLQATLYRGDKIVKVLKKNSSTSGNWKDVNIKVKPTKTRITRVDFDFGYGSGNEIKVQAGFFTTCPN